MPAAPPSPARLPFVEMLRALGSHLIVWHHLAFYGPLSDVAWPVAPVLLELLYGYGRMAVQIFFVVGGFLTARSLTRAGPAGPRDLLDIIRQRYRRIGAPYLVALVAAVVANEVARAWMNHDSISSTPTLAQLASHALFLHTVLGHEALTAGIWYLAIDFQFVILVAVIHLVATRAARRWPRVGAFEVAKGLCWLLALAALFGFNRDGRFDPFVVYFFASYFLGMSARWALDGRLSPALFAGYVGLVAVAVGVDFRPRLVVAALIALTLFVAGRSGLLQRWPRSPLVAYLGQISYSLFLIHFPVCLLVNALLWKPFEHSPRAALAGMGLAYVLSLAASVAFHHLVEARFARVGVAPKPAAA